MAVETKAAYFHYTTNHDNHDALVSIKIPKYYVQNNKDNKKVSNTNGNNGKDNNKKTGSRYTARLSKRTRKRSKKGKYRNGDSNINKVCLLRNVFPLKRKKADNSSDNAKKKAASDLRFKRKK